MYKPDRERRRRAEENACSGISTEDLEKGGSVQDLILALWNFIENGESGGEEFFNLRERVYPFKR